VARTAHELEETARLAGGRAVPIAADAAIPKEVEHTVRQVESQLGTIDLLVNNAAIGGPFGPIWQIDPGDWWRCQEVDLRGPMLCCRHVLPGMVERRRGRIVNMVSGAGTVAFENMSAYGVAKTALIRFTEHLALELQPHGVTVFAVRPGVVRTAMVEEARHSIPLIQRLLDEGRDVTAAAVADLIAALASGRADLLSGRLFSVGDDVDALAARAEEIRAQDSRLLRARP
jgi:NAD(P)-dependent dehydrogenase (short-subunit alcohol dehydrogenase family)